VKKAIHLLFGAGLLLGQLFSNAALAGIALSVEPSPLAVSGAGATFSVDIVISGLDGAGPGGTNEIVQGYDMLLGYDDTLLTATSVTFSGFLGDGLGFPPTGTSEQDFDLAFNPTGLSGYSGFPTAVEFAEISHLPNITLDTSQPNTFTLVTVAFAVKNLALGKYQTTLDLFQDPASGFDIKGWDGVNALIVALNDGVLTIPEPGTLALFLGAGLLGLGREVVRRRSKTAEQ
jgi:hypothetical protein